MGIKEDFIILAILFVLTLGLGACDNNDHQVDIRNKLQSELSVEPTNVEEKNPYWGETPFTCNTKGTRIYRFTYNKDGQEKHGWVRFQTFSKNWIMDGDK